MSAMVQLNSNPALLVIDMQNGFCHDKGTFAKLGLDVTPMREVVPAINKLRSICREHKVPIYYTRMGRSADNSDGGLVFIQPIVDLQGFIRDTWDADIVDELQPNHDEIVLDKTRNSAFIRTRFAEMLAERKINHLIATGVGTNVCVESTVRDAWQNDFAVVTVSDATATLSEAEHNATLKNMQWFGGTATVSEIEEALRQLK